MSDNDNIVPFGTVIGGKDDTTKEDKGPENNYVIIDIDEEEWYENGFLVFTTHHIAIMRDIGPGAIPALVVPLERVKAARLVDDE